MQTKAIQMQTNLHRCKQTYTDANKPTQTQTNATQTQTKATQTQITVFEKGK